MQTNYMQKGTHLPNECSGYDIKSSDGEPPNLESVEYSFVAIAPSFTLTGVVTPDRVLSMSQIELFDVSIVCKQMSDI